MKTVEELYYGNISAYDLKMPKSWHDLRIKLLKLETDLETNLSKTQSELLDKTRNLFGEMINIERCLSFKYGLSIGINLASESNNFINELNSQD